MSFCQEDYNQTLYFKSKSTLIKTEFFFTASSTLKDKAFLHEKEFEALSKFQHKKSQEAYLLGRYAAKKALSYYEGSTLPLTFFWIDSGIFNQPIVCNYQNRLLFKLTSGREFEGGSEKRTGVYVSVHEDLSIEPTPKLPAEAEFGKGSNIQVTLSHCDNRAVALAFPEFFPMGIDIEKIDQDKKATIEFILTVHEKQLLKGYMCSEVLYMIFWTTKEALSKALRTGFLSPPHIYEIDAIQSHKDYWTVSFKNFPQYQGLCFQRENFVLSFVFPANSYLLLE